MSERDLLVQQLVTHEGLRLKPYTDPAGKLSIGAGRNLTDCGISRDEAELLLNNDIDAAVADLATFPWFPTLDAVRQRALVDLRFNVGGAGFLKFKKLIAAIGTGDYVQAGEELMKSKVAPNRKQTLARMLATGIGVLFLAASVSAQSVVVDRWTPALPTTTERQVADVASWATAITAVALDSKASWDAPDRLRAFEKEGARIGLVYGSAYLVKTLTHRTRPCAPACGIDNPNASMFSAHTALAFSTTRWSFAVSTGSLRIGAGKHWLTDVLVGAGVGTLTSRIRE